MEVCCTICGCNDVEILSEPESVDTSAGPWTTPGRAQCNYCNRAFTYKYDEPERTRPLTYEVHCPRCQSPDVKVASSPAERGGFKTRYLECNRCSHDFKTIDRVEPLPDIHTR